ncbi:uncharacterized protein LAESUDRAFT_321037 [Laetiporus sulphureus 93-53]|uniref:Uncharacterized protein n=1 Tax=Laetiporus sulphureus 93-53 TaxID=1314785 RepID=A0A165D1J5_9APHY|nr:uncharacterized protein LAESUDRAFT_321037 [Laetiporus sulphureus 93-53]KZT03962.1 hypothetical protein LAESUDRAFT_321037 [Laetiporus sulphureus 93-53]
MLYVRALVPSIASTKTAQVVNASVAISRAVRPMTHCAAVLICINPLAVAVGRAEACCVIGCSCISLTGVHHGVRPSRREVAALRRSHEARYDKLEFLCQSLWAVSKRSPSTLST